MNLIKKNLIYNIFYQILIIIIPLITTPYVSRILGADGVGRYSYAYSIAYYFVTVAMLGVNNYGNRTIAAISDDRKKRSKVFWSIYCFQLFVALIVVFSYIFYVMFISLDKKISWIMLTYVLSALLDINWFFFGMEKFKVTVARNSAVKLLTVLCIFAFVRDSRDIYIYAFVSVAGMFLAQTILWIMLWKYVSPVKIVLSDVIPHIKPNLLLFIPTIAISLYKFMDKIMLGIMSTNSEVGYFESCEKILQIPIALITALGTVMLPRVSNMLANNQEKESLQYLRKSLIFTIFIVSPMSFGIMAVAREFVPIFYGVGYDRCVEIFQVIMPSCIFLAFANVIRTQYLMPHKKDRLYTMSVFAGAAVNIVVNFVLIPHYQSVGAAVATLAAEATVCFVQCWGIRKEINTLKYAIYAMPFLFASIVMYVVLGKMQLDMNSNLIALAVKILMGLFIYTVISGIIILIAARMDLIEIKNTKADYEQSMTDG